MREGEEEREEQSHEHKITHDFSQKLKERAERRAFASHTNHKFNHENTCGPLKARNLKGETNPRERMWKKEMA